jgi:hypothetical protein
MSSAATPDLMRMLRVRRTLFIAVLVATAAFFLVAPLTAAGNLGYLVLAIGLLVTLIRYVGSTCPACRRPFFAPGDSALAAWKLQPFRSSCANCGASLGDGTS